MIDDSLLPSESMEGKNEKNLHQLSSESKYWARVPQHLKKRTHVRSWNVPPGIENTSL